METTWIGKRLERIQLDQSLWESHVALQTLLAVPPGLAASGHPAAATQKLTRGSKR